MILKEIKKIIEDKNLNTDVDIESLSSIAAYSILKNDFFKDSYCYLGLIKDKKATRLYIPYLNYAKGFKNHTLNEGFIDSKSEEIEHNIYDRFNNYKKYIKKEEIERIEDFISVLKKDNIEEIKNVLLKKENEDSLYIPTIMRYLIQDKRDDSIKLIKFIIENLKKSEKRFNIETKKDINYMSEYKIEGNDSFYSDDFCFNYIEDDLVSKLVNYRKINELQKDKQIESAKEYLKNKRVPEELIPLLISEENKESKKNQVLNYYYKNLSGKLIEKFEEKIKEYKAVEDLINKYKTEIEIIKIELEKKYIELRGDREISFEFISGTGNLYNEIKENNKLVLLSNNYYLADNLKLNGISYSASEIKEDSDEEEKRKCLLLKTKNQIIGLLLFNEEENNVIKIDYLEINKNFRRQGLSKKIFEWLSDYSIANNKIIKSTSYTENGRSYLPKTKKTLNKEKRSLFLDLEEGGDNFDRESANLNQKLVFLLKDIKNFNLKSFKKVYEQNVIKLIEECKKKDFLSYDFTIDLSQKIIKDYQKLIKKEIKSKNKSAM